MYVQRNGNRDIKCPLILSGSSLIAAIITGNATKSPTPQAFHEFIYLYSNTLQLQRQEIKKTKDKKKHNVSKMHTNYARLNRKITSSTQN